MDAVTAKAWHCNQPSGLLPQPVISRLRQAVAPAKHRTSSSRCARVCRRELGGQSFLQRATRNRQLRASNADNDRLLSPDVSNGEPKRLLSQQPDDEVQSVIVADASETPLHNFMRGVHEWIESGVGSIVLLAATALSLLLANLGPTANAWHNLWEMGIGPQIGHEVLSLRSWVNEGLMAIFFFVVGLEIKREFVVGSLATISKAILPCMAALGGMVVPMAVYTLCNLQPGGNMSGWAVPMATDIAFAMGIYGFFRSRMPKATSGFLLTLATVDDLGAIAVIAFLFTGHLNISYLASALGAMGAMYYLNYRGRTEKVVNVAGLAALGVALWYCLLRGGVNSDVAGVITAAFFPVHAPAPRTSPAPPEHGEDKPTMMDHLIYYWAPVSTLLIMPTFALANTGVVIDLALASQALTAPIGLGILAGLLIGKPIGITLFSLLSVRLGIAESPEGVKTHHLVTVGMLGGIGFTMSLFLISLAFPAGSVSANLAKLSILLASFGAAIISSVIMSTYKVESLPKGDGEPRPRMIPSAAAS